MSIWKGDVFSWHISPPGRSSAYRFGENTPGIPVQAVLPLMSESLAEVALVVDPGGFRGTPPRQVVGRLHRAKVKESAV